MITTLQTKEQWWKLLEEDPTNSSVRLMFADWLEEKGETILANGQRRQVKDGRKPEKMGILELYYWHDPNICNSKEDDVPHNIDSAIFRFLKTGNPFATIPCLRKYTSLQEAEEDFANAVDYD